MRYAELSRRLNAGDAGTVHGWAAGLLDRIARGHADVPAVRHPLGFVCFRVERSGSDGVCLHVWESSAPPADPTTSEVHAHSWDLLSLVLYGQVRNTVFDAIPAPRAEESMLRLCEVHSTAGGDRIRATDRFVRLAALRSELHRTGAVYRLPAGVFHTSLVPGIAATVALGHGVDGAVDLSVAPVHTRTHEVHRTACSAAEVERAAREATAMLGRQA